jgi:hypothetical protein
MVLKLPDNRAYYATKPWVFKICKDKHFASNTSCNVDNECHLTMRSRCASILPMVLFSDELDWNIRHLQKKNRGHPMSGTHHHHGKHATH